MTTISQDLSYAWRSLRKRPGFAAVAIVTLALGIGANTAIFSVVQGVVLEPLPYPEPGRLMTVWEDHTARGGPAREWTGRANFLDWRARNRVFEHVAVYTGWGPNLTGVGEPERLVGELVSAAYFAALGVEPAAGRAFTGVDEDPGAERVVIVTDGLWRRRFGGDPGILGKTVSLDGEPYAVVGVLPAGFESPFTADVEIWRPLPFRPGDDDRGSYFLRAVGRLRPGVSLDLARSDLTRVGRELSGEHPEYYRDVAVSVVPLHEIVVGPTRPALLALMGSVGFVLLIACANVANLLLARSAARRREMAIRASLGAGRARIMRQLLTESLLLTLLGGGLGLLAGTWGIEALKSIAPAGAPRLDGVGLNLEVLAFTAGLTLLTGLLFGLAPALRASRPDLVGSLQHGERAGGGAARSRLRGALVVSEVALALVLLIGAGLLIRSFWGLTRVDPGFRAAGAIGANLQLPRTSYREPEAIAAFFDQLLERLDARPSLAAAGAVSVLPLSGDDSDVDVTIEGRPAPAPGDRAGVWYRAVSSGYFETMGIRRVAGRGFTDRDRAGSMPVAIVNETLARRHFAGEDPIGQRLKLGGPDSTRPWRTIVGVIGDVRHKGLGLEPAEELFLPHAQFPRRIMTVVMRPRSEAVEALEVLRSEVRALDPDLPIGGVTSLTALVRGSLALPRFTALMLATFAALALALAAIGVYGVLSYAVSRRRREIGVRMALGADRGDVLALVVGGGLRLIGAGLAIGLPLALVASRLLRRLLIEISPHDPLTLGATAVVLVAAGSLACYLPARRAARFDPVVSLRHQ